MSEHMEFTYRGFEVSANMNNGEWVYCVYKDKKQILTNHGDGTIEEARKAAIKHIDGQLALYNREDFIHEVQHA